MKVAIFDLETTSLKANFGVILCGSIKGFGEKKVTTFRADSYSTWDKHRSDDSAVAKAIYKELIKYDIWVAHNGVKFDVPFLTTRLLPKGIIVPKQKIIDPVKLARRHLRLGYNSLQQIAEYFELGNKNPVSSRQWLRASLDGDRKAMDYIVKHCEQDVVLLEKVMDKIRPYVSKIDNWGSDK